MSNMLFDSGAIGENNAMLINTRQQRISSERKSQNSNNEQKIIEEYMQQINAAK